MRVLVLSFSGGRTSAYMTKRCLEELRGKYDLVIVVFSNTGQEHEETLQFVHLCDTHFGFKVVWLESEIHDGRVGTTHRIVTYETACRDGSLFEAMVQKYGIPNKSYPHCTRELKLQPIESYLRSLGVGRSVRDVAVGIRADETRRVRKDAAKDSIIYPLVEWGVTKQDVLDWWEDQTFDLQIPEHYGNCVWCWKKSLNKHMRLIAEMPECFAVPSWLEVCYPQAGNSSDKSTIRRFFRGDLSTHDLFRQYAELGGVLPPLRESDFSDGCAESCELFQTVDTAVNLPHNAPHHTSEEK